MDPERTSGWEGKTYKAVVKFSRNQDLWDRWSAIFRSKVVYRGRTGSKAANKFFDLNKDLMLTGSEVLWPQRHMRRSVLSKAPLRYAFLKTGGRSLSRPFFTLKFTLLPKILLLREKLGVGKKEKD